MSRKRIFTVHVNIDDMTALFQGLDGKDEKSDWLDGYMAGVHGHEPRETWSQAKSSGCQFGQTHFAESEAFRATQTAKSLLATEAKRTRTVPTGTTGEHPDGTRGYTRGGTQSNNPTIQQSTKRTSEQTTAGAPSAATWLEYRKIEFPWWPDCDAESAYAYYEGSGWQGVNLKFWQAKVRACATRWKESHQAEFGEFARKAKAKVEPRTGGFLAIEEERKAIQARIAEEKALVTE